MKFNKERFISFLKQNTLSIFILICIILYTITRWGFSKDTIDYRIDAHSERVELENHIDVLETEILNLTDKIDKLEEKLDKFHNIE